MCVLGSRYIIIVPQLRSVFLQEVLAIVSFVSSCVRCDQSKNLSIISMYRTSISLSISITFVRCVTDGSLAHRYLRWKRLFFSDLRESCNYHSYAWRFYEYVCMTLFRKSVQRIWHDQVHLWMPVSGCFTCRRITWYPSWVFTIAHKEYQKHTLKVCHMGSLCVVPVSRIVLLQTEWSLNILHALLKFPGTHNITHVKCP